MSNFVVTEVKIEFAIFLRICGTGNSRRELHLNFLLQMFVNIYGQSDPESKLVF